MGKIFGISDLPVTIFTTPLEPVKVPHPVDMKLPRFILGQSFAKHDVVITQNKVLTKRGFLGRLINGFRKV